MSNYTSLKATIDANVKQNNNQAITGQILNSVLNEMVNSLGEGYLFKGVATTSTNPGSPDSKVFYVATPGTYQYFGDQTVPEASAGFFKWDTSWHLEVISTGVANGAITTQKLANGAVTQAKLASSLVEKLFATGYKFMGVANPSTNPGDPSQQIFYLAGKGTYTHFGGIEVNEGEIAALYFDSLWHKDYIQVVSPQDFPVGIRESSQTDLDLADERGNVIARFSQGHIKVKNFDSSKVAVEVTDSVNADLDLADENGNVIARFSQGHFKVKNFDTRTAKNLPFEEFDCGEIPPYYLLDYQYLTKQQILTLPSAGELGDRLIESPAIWYEPSLGKLCMVYTAYTNSGNTYYASHAWATSEDGLTWVKQEGAFWTPSNIPGTPDAAGTTGPLMVIYKNKYYLFYIGLTETGYERGTKTLCLAVGDSLSDFPNGTAERKGSVLVPTGSGWNGRAVWHPNVVRHNGKWYIFINCLGNDGNERVGYAVSDHLDKGYEWGVPLLNYIDESSRNVLITIDPSVIKWGNFFIMGYGSRMAADRKARDEWAYTTLDEFPFGWRFGGLSLLPDTSWDGNAAHKPFLIKFKGRIYHYYSAISETGSITSIGVIY